MPTPDVCSGWEIDVVDYEMKFDDSPSFTILRKNGASDNSCSRSSNCTPSTSSIKRSKSLSDVSGMDSLTADVVEVSRSVSRAICKEGACSDKLSEYCGSHSAVIQFSLTSDVKDDGEDDGEVRDCDFSLSSLDEESDADMQSESSDLFGGEQIALVKHLIKLFEEKCESKEEEEMMKLSMQLAGQKEVDSEETQHERTGKEEEEEVELHDGSHNDLILTLFFAFEEIKDRCGQRTTQYCSSFDIGRIMDILWEDSAAIALLSG